MKRRLAVMMCALTLPVGAMASGTVSAGDGGGGQHCTQYRTKRVCQICLPVGPGVCHYVVVITPGNPNN